MRSGPEEEEWGGGLSIRRARVPPRGIIPTESEESSTWISPPPG